MGLGRRPSVEPFARRESYWPLHSRRWRRCEEGAGRRIHLSLAAIGRRSPNLVWRVWVCPCLQRRIALANEAFAVLDAKEPGMLARMTLSDRTKHLSKKARGDRLAATGARCSRGGSHHHSGRAWRSGMTMLRLAIVGGTSLHTMHVIMEHPARHIIAIAHD